MANEIMIRITVIVGLIAVVAIGCAGESQTRRSELDYCTCEMWGVSGPPPPPDYQPPPRPAACERILKRQSDPDCPIPP